MPELAEVDYFRKQWVPALGQTVAGVQLNAGKRVFRGVDLASLREGLPGCRFEHSEAHGKQMCFRFGQRFWLGVHLGMTGRTALYPAGHTVAKHDHLLIEMRSGQRLVFTDPRLFGRIHFSESVDEPSWWADRPPAILSAGFTRERLDAFLKRRAKSPIKAVLLMQEMFPGVGNWMADEILWRCRIRPDRRCGRIGPRKRGELYEVTREVCADALRVIGDGWQRPPDSWLFNHRWRDGGRCPKTGGPLRRTQVGGRTSCWSAQWQR